MPELPDLQIFKTNLQNRFAGRTLQSVTVFNNKKLNVSTSQMKESIEGQLLRTVIREGKELHFHFENGQILGLHLMLKGQLQLFTESNQFKSKIIELLFNDNSGLAMMDFMGQATPTLNPVVSDVPDALSDEANSEYLKKRLTTAKAPNIKAFLIDQNNIKGIGNAYVDEILWDAKISPFSICSKLPEEKVKALSNSIKSVLKDAEKQILNSNPNLISGEVRDFLKVHTTKNKVSPTGMPILFKEVNSKKTYYTDEQELFE